MPKYGVPEMPGDLIRNTNDLLVTLDNTVASLHEFTEKLRAATAAAKEEHRD